MILGQAALSVPCMNDAPSAPVMQCRIFNGATHLRSRKALCELRMCAYDDLLLAWLCKLSAPPVVAYHRTTGALGTDVTTEMALYFTELRHVSFTRFLNRELGDTLYLSSQAMHFVTEMRILRGFIDEDGVEVIWMREGIDARDAQAGCGCVRYWYWRL